MKGFLLLGVLCLGNGQEVKVKSNAPAFISTAIMTRRVFGSKFYRITG